MEEEINFEMESAKEAMEKALARLDNELTKVRAGRANASMLSQVYVDYYGTKTALSQIGNISAPDAKTLVVQPWEKGMLDPICKAIIDSNLGLNPQNNGDNVFMNIPALTEERRKNLVKQTKSYGEDAKVSIRNARKDANIMIKKFQKDGLDEDTAKKLEEDIQELTNTYVAKVDKVLEEKEKDIMTV